MRFARTDRTGLRGLTAAVLAVGLALRLIGAPVVLSAPEPGLIAICSGGEIYYVTMDGLATGTTSLDPTVAATTLPNRFSGMPMQPPTLRVIPEEMDMRMHMFGAD